MSADTMWIVGTAVAARRLPVSCTRWVGGVNNTVSTGLAAVNKRLDDVRADLPRLHDGQDRFRERLRAVGR